MLQELALSAIRKVFGTTLNIYPILNVAHCECYRTI